MGSILAAWTWYLTRRKAAWSSRQSNTLLMDEHIPLDGEILKLAAAEIDRAEKVSSTRLGEATDDFWIPRPCRTRRRRSTTLSSRRLRTRWGERGAKVDAIVHGINERRYGLKKGAITVGDVWKVVPYENTVGVVQLTPAELREGPG